MTRVPRNFIYFDSEARREPTTYGEVQTFRLAVAMHDRRRHDQDCWVRSDLAHFYDPETLWSWVDARAQARARTVCVAHNLAYDLRITGTLEFLPRLGWELKAIQLDHGGVWCSWQNEKRTLLLCDSMAWVPVSLDRLGAMVEVAKLPLPAWDDSDEAWLARCTRDVEILSEACRRLWGWVRDDDLGNWKPTGAGQAWAAFRHRFMHDRLLAHDNGDARVAERRAAWTGRCEVWTHGRPRGGPFTEWDFSAAYAHVGADSRVPVALCGSRAETSLERWHQLTKRFAVLSECTVTTDVPTVPTLIDGRIAWPVGTFATTLWENELALALDHGADVALSRVWWYRRAPALAEFCGWVLGVLGGRSGPLDPVVVCAVKHWSRALVGRFGARWSEWETVGRSESDGLSLGKVIDQANDEVWDLLQVGKDLRRRSALTDSADSVVSIMSWIMAECQVRLWRVTEAAGQDNVLYMDTDGVIVNRAGHEALLSAAVPGLRIKGSYGTCELLGPRQIVLSGELRASGVPRQAVKVAASTWEAEVWSEMSTSIRNGTPSQVDVTRRRIRLSGRNARREHLPGGRTAPRVVTSEVSETA